MTPGELTANVPKDSMRLVATTRLFVLVASGLAPSFAQLSASRDVTVFWRVPSDRVPRPSPQACPTVDATVSHGAVVNGIQPDSKPQPEKLELGIVAISPVALHIGESFTATIRLKNAGTAEVRIPWQIDGEKAVQLLPDSREQYEVADVSFSLATVSGKAAAIPLQSEGALFARPDDPATYFAIQPGHWVHIRMKGRVDCGLPHCAGEIRTNEHSTLSARWYQRLLTHQVKGCNDDHGAYTVREVSSAPFGVAVRHVTGEKP